MRIFLNVKELQEMKNNAEFLITFIKLLLVLTSYISTLGNFGTILL